MTAINKYLSWLCRAQANALINVCIKIADNRKLAGYIVTIDNAVEQFAKFDIDNDYAAIWASVHHIKNNTDTEKDRISKLDISDYRYLAIDIDCKVAHANKVSATDKERQKCLDKAATIDAFLRQHGISAVPLKIMSGNGALLLYPIDLPNNETNYAIMDKLAKVISEKFDDTDCDIDRAVVKDPSRILGVVGTFNRSKKDVPSEGRVAQMRTVIGEYPPNTPMTAEAFITAANSIIAEHGGQGEAENGEQTLLKVGGVDTDNVYDKLRDRPIVDKISACESYISKVPNANEGQRGSDATLRAAAECWRFGLSDVEAADIMAWYNENKCHPQWSQAEITHKLADAKKIVGSDFGIYLRTNATVDTPNLETPSSLPNMAYPLSDIGNAEHFRDTHIDRWRYVSQWKTWLYYNGKCWRRDENNGIHREAISHIRYNMSEYAKGIENLDDRSKFLKWAATSQSENKVAAMLTLASSLMAISAAELDAKNNLFNIANGTIELDTLKFRDHNRDDMLTAMSAVVFEPTATCPLWDKFIERIFMDAGGNRRIEIEQFVQRAVGYSITADTSEQCFFLLHGNGRNGKTTYMDAIKFVMGDYAKVGMQSLIVDMGKNSSRNTDDEADLQGCGLMLVSETDTAQNMNESKVKRLVGNGRIKVMKKYGHPYEFEPTHKLWMDCNYKPKVRSDGDGIWRRIKCIPFETQIGYEERDPHMGEKLQLEASGILNWILSGLSQWRQHGLNEPNAVSDATNQYRSESDTFGLFIKDCIENNDAEKTHSRAAYTVYCRWAEANGMTFKMTNIEFGKKMVSRGYKKIKSHGVGYYVGFRTLKCWDSPNGSEYKFNSEESDTPY